MSLAITETLPGVEPAKLYRPDPLSLTSTCRDDLPALGTTFGFRLARQLTSILDNLDFDCTAYMLRCDYATSPLPAASLYTLEEAFSHLADPVEADTLRFFMLGFGVHPGLLLNPEIGLTLDFLSDAIRGGLFRLLPDGRLQMNGPLVGSMQISSRETVYYVADRPPYLTSTGEPERVYTGTDSLLLNSRLQQFTSLDGVIVEAGAGSGIQLITMLKRNPGVSAALAIENDARAGHILKFNAAMSGLEDKVYHVSRIEEVKELIPSGSVSLAFSNPPFLIAPEWIPLPSSLRTDAWREFPFFEVAGQTFLPMNKLFPQSGWGGPDGLRITDRFVREIFPTLRKDGKYLVFSQFGGNETAPTKALDLMESIVDGHTGVFFEAFAHPGSRMTAREWASALARGTTKFNPEMERRLLRDAVFKETSTCLESNGFSHIHTGFIVLERNRLQPVGRSIRLATSMPDRGAEFHIPSPAPVVQSGLILGKASRN